MSIIHDFNQVSQFPLNDPMIRIHENTNHVCLMRPFPTCHYNSDTIEDYKKFHLRFYIPKKPVVNLEKKINRVVVMLNGLDEINFFTLYDQLGQKFAELNIASILLPIPSHLNRNPRFRHKPNYTRRPSADLFENPSLGVEVYLQVMEELDILVDHLRLKDCPKKNAECSFFKNLLAPHVRISLLGYSIGSLAVLANFISNPSKYNACFSLNGGIQLSDLEFPHEFIDQDKWDEFVGTLQNEWDIISKQYINHSIYLRYFSRIFLGGFSADLKKDMRRLSRRMLFIFGGKDRVIPYTSFENIEPKEHGLSVLKIPGMGHFLPIEKEWSKWLDIIVNLINSFEQNAVHELLTSIEIIEASLKLDRKYKYFTRNPSFFSDAKLIINDYDLEKISNRKDRAYAEQLFFASLAYYSQEMLVNELNKQYIKHSFGEIALKNGFISKNKLRECLEFKKGNPDILIGKIVQDKGYMTEKEINEVLKEQRSFYKYDSR